MNTTKAYGFHVCTVKSVFCFLDHLPSWKAELHDGIMVYFITLVADTGEVPKPTTYDGWHLGSHIMINYIKCYKKYLVDETALSSSKKILLTKTTWPPRWTTAWLRSLRRCPWSSSCSQPEHFLADLLVAPGVALQPLPPDSNHVQVGNATDLQFKAELGSTTWVSDFSSQDIALLLTGNALNVNWRLSLVWMFVYLEH